MASPETLTSLCSNIIIKCPARVNSGLNYKLPPELGHLIFEAFRSEAKTQRWSSQDIKSFLNIFKHKYIPLTKINLSGLQLSSDIFPEFVKKYQDQLEELDISECVGGPKLKTNLKELNEILKHNRSKHKTLIIGDTFSEACALEGLFDDDLRLKKLVLHNFLYTPRFPDENPTPLEGMVDRILTPNLSHSLKYLDLSMSLIGRGQALIQLESLEVLILYNCYMDYSDVINTISLLRNLTSLDISRQVESDESMGGEIEDPKLLDLLVSRLPNLARLDISGTNLIGGKDRNISAFEARIDKPFAFLGVFHTGNDAAFRSCIPAQIVAGEATETQMLNACEAYMNRPKQLEKALGDLYNYYKTVTPSETFDDLDRALDVVLPILTKHINDEHVIIYTTAALWCIVKINVTSRNLNDARIRRNITSRLLDVMHCHKSNRVILINGGLTLLLLPDIICEHSRVATISLLMCRDDDPRTQGFGTTLLNTLACQVGGDQKIFIGKLDAIETMLQIITKKIEDETCDETLETAWSTLWNITDETPVNCEKFLARDGLRAFESCMDKFSENKEVLRNIMGLLGNVAECQPLRKNFMRANYINRFYDLLTSQIDGIECSYNACGTLAYLVSDGADFWEEHLPNVCRYRFLNAMRQAISSWPINSRRNINYRSFEPIVRLLDTSIVAQAQYWAVFALTNLTRVNPSKYCPMLVPYGGLAKLRRLATQPFVSEPYVQQLAQVTVYQYDRFEREGTLAGLDKTDSINLEELRNFRAPDSVEGSASELGDQML